MSKEVRTPSISVECSLPMKNPARKKAAHTQTHNNSMRTALNICTVSIYRILISSAHKHRGLCNNGSIVWLKPFLLTMIFKTLSSCCFPTANLSLVNCSLYTLLPLFPVKQQTILGKHEKRPKSNTQTQKANEKDIHTVV